MYVLNALARLSRPLHLLLAALTYVLGAGVARYLGFPTRLHAVLLGLLGILLTQASMGLLQGVFRSTRERMVADERDEQRRSVRTAALYASIPASGVRA